MKTTTFLMVSLIAALSTAKAYANVDAKSQKLCDAVTDLRSDVKKLDAIDSSSSLTELRAAVDRVSTDAMKIQKAAPASLGTSTVSDFRAAAKKLHTDATALPESTPISEAKSKLDADITKVKEQARSIGDQAECSDKMGTERNKMNSGSDRQGSSYDPDLPQ